MGSGSGKDDDRTASRIALAITAMVMVVILVTPVIVLIILDNGGENGDVRYADYSGSATGNSPMDSEARERWENYLEGAPTVEIIPPVSEPEFKKMELELLDNLPEGVSPQSDDEYYKNGGTPDPPSYSDDDDSDDIAADAEGDSQDRGSDREVEEADIINSVGDRLYILNSYLGLVIVNLEDPAEPYIEGRCRVLGNPTSMYIVDFLGFVIASGVPDLEGSGSWNAGMLYILDLTDPSDPRIVKAVEIDGYPVDSRRVGDVIYIVSNEEYYYYFDTWGIRGALDIDVAMAEEEYFLDEGSPEDEGPKTTILSIGFYDPEMLGEVDRVSIPGNSGKIHASQFAIFIPQDIGYYWEEPMTKFTYVDISDPEGDIKVRGSVEVIGFLSDRFQMDHYRGMFRVVTQRWPSWDRGDEFPSSTLRVIDARDPDDLKEVSKLLIDDEGNLMATRFAGERAYTIHLPESIDPLDVIDLSDPADPKLTDVLEIPGWVEHLEVIGYKIIAIGVDNEEERKVALYLFDVEDAEKAILEDRVVIGEGYTYSEANWDEKALSIFEDQELVAIPYSSYDWSSYYGQTNGIQLVSFDLEDGKLNLEGNVEGKGQMKRTRIVNGNLIATSEQVLQSVDISDPSSPVIDASLDLAVDIRDAFEVDGKLVCMVQPPWDGSGARIRVSEPSDEYKPLLEYGPEGLDFETFSREGTSIFIKGIRQGPGIEEPVMEVHLYDVSDPMDPVHFKVAEITIPRDQYEPYKYGIYEDDSGFSEAEPYNMIYWDPTQMKVLDDRTLAVYSTYYYDFWGSYMEEQNTYYHDVVKLLHWESRENLEKTGIDIPTDASGINDIFGDSERLFLSSFGYRYEGGSYKYYSTLTKADLTAEAVVLSDSMELGGRVIGISEDGTLAYTEMSYYWESRDRTTLNIYDISGDAPVYVSGLQTDEYNYDVHFLGDRIIMTARDWGWYYYDDYYYEEVVYDEGEGVEDGAVEKEEGSGDELPYPEAPPQETRIHIIELADGRFGEHSLLTLDKIYHTSLVQDDFLVMESGNEIIILSLEKTEAQHIGTWWSAGWVYGGEVTEDSAILAMGNYGIVRFDM
ncbi:MAG: beta-propeller domain-containing protein [Thermoplasmatota archaeon]